jgi:hypothetical protein
VTLGNNAGAVRLAGGAAKSRDVKGWTAVRRIVLAPAGLALFLIVWTAMAAQLPASRLVSPFATALDLWNNFLSSPRLAVFGLGNTGYAAMLLYTTRNLFIGLVVGSAIGIVVGIASARFASIAAIRRSDRARVGNGSGSHCGPPISPVVRSCPFHAGSAGRYLQCNHDDDLR